MAPIDPFSGRVTIMDDFLPSETMITLGKFKEYAAKVQVELGFEEVQTTFGEEISDEALIILKRNEAQFFDIMINRVGDEGKEVTLRYCVDVEAEGAYDPSAKCHTEYTGTVTIFRSIRRIRTTRSPGKKKTEETRWMCKRS